MSEKITVIITPMARNASLLAKPPLHVNGKTYPYEFDKPVPLPDFVVEVAERADSIEVVRVGNDAATGTAAEAGGAEAGGPDTHTPVEEEAAPDATETKPAVSDEEYTVPEGYGVTEKGGGYYEITGPEGFETVKVRGKDALAEALAKLA